MSGQVISGHSLEMMRLVDSGKADVIFSHGICDNCLKIYYPEEYEMMMKNK